MNEPKLSDVREVMKQLQFLVKRSSPAQVLGFISGLDFTEEFGGHPDFDESKTIAQEDAGREVSL